MREAVKILKALSDPGRLRIISLLLRRDLCVCELMFILKMEQSRISHQLRILRDAGIVEDKREGRWIIYGIPEESRKGLDLLLEKFLSQELGKSKEVAADLAALEMCLKQDIRRQKSLPTSCSRRAR